MSENLKQEVKEFLDSCEHDIIRDFFTSDISFSQKSLEYMQTNSRYYEDQLALYKTFTDLGITIEQEDSHGGEGQGDEYWSVYSFAKGDDKVYVKFDGWYQSYNGAEFTEWFFVQPKEKVITVFDRI